MDSKPDIKKKIRMAIADAENDKKVAYVKAQVGSDIVHVRCEDQNQAKKLANTSIGHEISKDILDGEEENEYYQDREETRLESSSEIAHQIVESWETLSLEETTKKIT